MPAPKSGGRVPGVLGEPASERVHAGALDLTTSRTG